jgi:hypothetical protein
MLGQARAPTQTEWNFAPSNEPVESSPADKASILSRLTFSYLLPLLQKGYASELKQEDLFPVPTAQSTETVASDFELAWEMEKRRSKKPSLAIALTRAFGRPFILAALFKLIYDLLQFVGPQVIVNPCVLGVIRCALGVESV